MRVSSSTRPLFEIVSLMYAKLCFEGKTNNKFKKILNISVCGVIFCLKCCSKYYIYSVQFILLEEKRL